MGRTFWFDPLLTFLRELPMGTETATLTLTEPGTVIGQPLPSAAGTRSYWRSRAPGSTGPRLAAIGWRVEQVQRRGEELTITFVRIAADSTA